MIKRAIIFIFLIAVSFQQVFPAVTTVRGSAVRAKGYQIRLTTYLDQVSYQEKTLAVSVIDEHGDFLLTFDIDRTIPAYLTIRFIKGEVFLQPGAAYEVSIDYDPSTGSDLYYEQELLNIEILNDDQHNLNKDIQNLNVIYNDFILNNFNAIYKWGRKSLVDSLHKSLEVEFKDQHNGYFRDYLKYMMASIELFSGKKSRTSLAVDYLTDQPLLYDNVEYIYFFNQFFEKYLLVNNDFISFSGLMDMFELKLPIEAFLDTLALDPELSNRNIREFLLLNSLKELYYMPGFPRKHILDLIRQVEQESPISMHRLIARNLDARFSNLRHETPAPGFTLKDNNGLLHSLSDLAGSYVYLCFYISDNPACLYELNLMKALYQQFGDRIQFVSISADRNKAIFETMLQQRDFPWTFLYFDNDYELLDHYDAKTFPVFILIDEKGRIFRYPVAMPSENAEAVLNGIY